MVRCPRRKETSGPRLQSELTLFDVTNLVVGAIIGADIYVASSFGAGYLGPTSLIVWVLAGVIAIVIALCFAQCSALLPKVGGPYAYSKEAWGPFIGFIVGWSLWLAEWISLAVFPVAFTRYLMFFLPNLEWIHRTMIKVLFVTFLIITNVVGVKAAGRTNDILTIIKLAPLIFFSAIALIYMIFHPEVTASNFSPFAPFGLSKFGEALLLIFWAYGEGVSPTTFKEHLLEFGFTDALNRVKLKVPIPSNSEPQSRLCNIFTDVVLRKLGNPDKLPPPSDGGEPSPTKPITLPDFARAQCELCGDWSDSCSKVEIMGRTTIVCPKCKETSHEL
jgi:hypothetical protein